jgi:hypothetical protein
MAAAQSLPCSYSEAPSACGILPPLVGLSAVLALSRVANLPSTYGSQDAYEGAEPPVMPVQRRDPLAADELDPTWRACTDRGGTAGDVDRAERAMRASG